MDRKPPSKYAATKENHMARVFPAHETGSNQFI